MRTPRQEERLALRALANATHRIRAAERNIANSTHAFRERLRQRRDAETAARAAVGPQYRDGLHPWQRESLQRVYDEWSTVKLRPGMGKSQFNTHYVERPALMSYYYRVPGDRTIRTGSRVCASLEDLRVMINRWNRDGTWTYWL